MTLRRRPGFTSLDLGTWGEVPNNQKFWKTGKCERDLGTLAYVPENGQSGIQGNALWA